MARRRGSRTNQRIALALSAGVFVIATVVAALNLPPVEGEVTWGYFVAVALLGVPAITWANGEEFAIIARLTGHEVSRAERIRVALIGTAANLLPIPGSILVRAQVLRQRGASLRSIGWATGATGVMWVGCTVLVAGALLAAFADQRVLGVAMVAVAVVVCSAAAWAILSRPNLAHHWRHVMSVFAIEMAFTVVSGLRLWGILAGLGFSVGIEQAMALTVAGLVSTAVGFAPGGLGIRELMAAAISPIVGLPASVGLLAAAVNRVIELSVLAPFSVSVVVRSRRPATGDYFPLHHQGAPYRARERALHHGKRADQ